MGNCSQPVKSSSTQGDLAAEMVVVVVEMPQEDSRVAAQPNHSWVTKLQLGCKQNLPSGRLTPGGDL